MTTYYMTGTTRCRNLANALSNVEHYRKPAVIRKTKDGFFDVTRLQDRPVKPGQYPFKLRENEEVYFSDLPG